MADADVLPYDYQAYAEEILGYLEQARSRAVGRDLKLDFTGALKAAERFEAAGTAVRVRQAAAAKDAAGVDRGLNAALAATERALLIPGGLPRRPWYRHSIYAPGEFTGYSAATIPGVNEGIDAMDAARAQAQLGVLGQALDRAAAVLGAVQ
jgi:N-acetylated-alpha-linked acidic dipeptidase